MRLTLGRLMILVAFLGFMAWFIRPGWVVVIGSIDRRMLTVFLVAVLLSKVIGQVWVTRRLWLGKPILAGEWLWLGSSSAFFLIGCCLTPPLNASHGGIDYGALILWLSAELITAITVAFCERRPGPGDPAWAHYAGWMSVGADALLFGLVARAELLY